VRVRTPTPSVSATLNTTTAITRPIVHANTLPDPDPIAERKNNPAHSKSTSVNKPPMHDANGCERRNGGSMYWWEGPHDESSPIILDMTSTIDYYCEIC
jgi:hypothetical protein